MRMRWSVSFAIAGIIFVAAPAYGGYQVPPKAIAEIVDAPPTPWVYFSPDRRTMLIAEVPNLPSIEEVAQPELRLAGLRINPTTNDRARMRYAKGFSFRSVDGDVERPVTGLPSDVGIRSMQFSPNGRSIAFVVSRKDRLEAWTADVQSGVARRLLSRPVNGVYGAPLSWMPDSRSLLVKALPDGRAAIPAEPAVPSGPIIQENIGKKAAARTYQDLLKNAHDEQMFEHVATSEALIVSLDGKVTSLGIRGIIAQLSPSPNGAYVLSRVIHRPFSYLVPVSRFPVRIDVRDRVGKVVATVAELPLAEDVPIGFASARLGPRSVSWRADAPAQLYWVEARDGGDPKKQVDVRDQVISWNAPFDGPRVDVIGLGDRFSGITWGDDGVAFVSSWWWKNRNEKTWVINPSDPQVKPQLLWDRSWEDRYNDPGSPVMTPTATGRSVMIVAGNGEDIYLRGQGASPEGNRPFLDRMNIRSRTVTRLWRSEAPHYESMSAFLDVDGGKIITRRESKTEPPNYFIRDLANGNLKQMTRFPNPTPQFAGVQKEMIRYQRDDGVKLNGTLYLPDGYDATKGPLPVLMWAYPQEFKSADAAGQVTDSPHRFVRASLYGALPWLTQGFAVLDDPSLPIIGENDEEPNDTYVKQLVAGAQAAVDELVRRGVGDRDRMAIGGHSYGAFMTANLLAHCDLFSAGIARSGAYNRTLTPFGFQSEERTFWESPEIYFEMSPFMHVDDINEPILLIHGEADNNSGTFPMQSERFYNALKGHGATAKLVMLPHESHGYRARESVLHMLYEMNAWLEKYVKSVPTTSQPSSTPPKPEDRL